MKEIFVVRIEAVPTTSVEDYESIGGAFVNVYIQAPDEAAAIKQSLTEVKDAGWLVRELIEVNLGSKEDFPDEENGIEYYEQAISEGVCVVFMLFPQDSEHAGLSQ